MLTSFLHTIDHIFHRTVNKRLLLLYYQVSLRPQIPEQQNIMEQSKATEELYAIKSAYKKKICILLTLSIVFNFLFRFLLVSQGDTVFSIVCLWNSHFKKYAMGLLTPKEKPVIWIAKHLISSMFFCELVQIFYPYSVLPIPYGYTWSVMGKS